MSLINILIALIIEYITMELSIKIRMKSLTNNVVKIGNKGLLIKDKKVLNENIVNNKMSRLDEVLITYIPIINIIYSVIENKLEYQKLYNELKENNALIKMSDIQKEEYKILKYKESKYMFITSALEAKERVQEKKFIPLVEDKKVEENNSIYLMFQRLTPMAYTKEEVLKLNSVTNHDCVFGTMDNINVAIIDFPYNHDDEFYVKYYFDNFNVKHKFKVMSDIDSNDKTFIVFPYAKQFDRNYNLISTYNDILEERHKNNINDKPKVLIKK